MCDMRKKREMKKIKKNVRMTSGKGGSGEEVCHILDHTVDGNPKEKRKEKRRK